VTGHIPGSGAEKGFLEVTWKYPGPDQSGNYQCTVLGTDQLGHFQTFKETVEVSNDDVSMNDVVGYIHQLKLTNDVQTSTIAALKQSNDLHTSTIASLKQSNDLYKTTLDIHTSTIASLKQSNDIQKSTIAKQSVAISDMDKVITELQQKQNTTVMFSAYLDHQVTASPRDVIVFNQITTNVGNGYNPSTGVFICPVSGYYVFDVHIQGQMDKYVGVYIYLNGSVLGYAHADDKFDYQSASGYVCVVLKQGDKVDVKAYVTSSLNGGSNRGCTFSGHLVNLI